MRTSVFLAPLHPPQTPTPHPPSETSSTGDRERVGTLLELEWDDTYDAGAGQGTDSRRSRRTAETHSGNA